MDDDLRPERAEQAQPLEQKKQRNQVGEAGRDARDQDHHRRLVRAHAGEPVARRHADQQRERGRGTGDDQAVGEIGREPLGVDHRSIVAPIEMLGDEDRRIRRVVDLKLDG